MDNGDLPVSPVFNDQGRVTGRLDMLSADGMGLSKREHFAIEMLKAIRISNAALCNSIDSEVDSALQYADKLLEKL